MRQIRSYIICSATIAAGIFLCGCPQSRIATPPPPIAIASPSQIAPPDQSVFANFPRTVHFRWSGAHENARYAIEIDCRDCCVTGRWCSDVQGTGYIVADLKQAEYEFNFWGDQQGRWRVWVIDAKSQPGPKSPWSGFSFISPGNASRTVPFGNTSQSSPPNESQEPVYSPGPGIIMAKPIYAPPGQYSDSARKSKVRGDVLMEVVIGADGTVGEARVVRPLHPELDSNALVALKRWKFEPASKDGKPVAIRGQISMSFNIQ